MSDGAIRFLVVDDDPDSRKQVVEYLRSMGYTQVTEAKDGAEAVVALERDPSIGFVISDWEMPSINGITLLQQVRSHPKRSGMPFLIMTSPISQESEKIVLAAENLVDAYVIKPFRLATLKEKIEQILEASTRGQKKAALVVDDDPDARRMVVEYLNQLGFTEVVEVPTGRAAVSYLSSSHDKISLIVSDWEMPEMTGIELLQHCKREKALAEIPFLMITSQSSMERMKVMQAAKERVDQYLLKPFRLEEFKKRLTAILDKDKTRHLVQAHVMQGIAALEQGKYELAENFFRQALDQDPSHDTALRGMGDALHRLRGIETAMSYYKKAVEANPMNPKSYVRLAQAYEQVGLVDKAISLLQTANQQINFSAELHYQLGKLYSKKGMAALAKEEFEKTLQIQVDHQEAEVMLKSIKDKK